MIRRTMFALALSIATATTATAGPVADMLEGALTAKDRHDLTADGLAVVRSRLSTWWIGGFCGEGHFETMEAMDEGHFSGAACCWAYRHGAKYVHVVQGASLIPWTPDLPEAERNTVVRLVLGEVLSMPEDAVKGELQDSGNHVTAATVERCEAAVRDEARH